MIESLQGCGCRKSSREEKSQFVWKGKSSERSLWLHRLKQNNFERMSISTYSKYITLELVLHLRYFKNNPYLDQLLPFQRKFVLPTFKIPSFRATFSNHFNLFSLRKKTLHYGFLTATQNSDSRKNKIRKIQMQQKNLRKIK